jgi:hypothetical protein
MQSMDALHAHSTLFQFDLALASVDVHDEP